jgi:hypothetical protein
MLRASTIARVATTAAARGSSSGRSLTRDEALVAVREGSGDVRPHHVLITTAASWNEALSVVAAMESHRCPVLPETLARAASRLLHDSRSLRPAGSESVARTPDDLVHAALVEAAINEHVMETDGAPPYLQLDEELSADVDDTPPSRQKLVTTGPALTPSAADSVVAQMLSLAARRAVPVTAATVRDLCLLPVRWERALECIAWGVTQCPGGLPPDAVAGAMARCLVHSGSQWRRAVQLLVAHEATPHVPSVAVAYQGFRAAQLMVGSADAATMNGVVDAATRELQRAQSDSWHAMTGDVGTAVLEAQALALMTTRRPEDALAAVDGMDLDGTPSHRMLVPTADGLVTAAAAALMTIGLEASQRYLALWGSMYGARWPAVSSSVAKVFWRACAGQSSAESNKLTVALARRAAAEAHLLTYPQIRPVMEALYRVAARARGSSAVLSPVWQAAAVLFDAADGVTAEHRESFVTHTFGAVASHGPTLLAVVERLQLGAFTSRFQGAVSAFATMSARRGDWAAAVSAVHAMRRRQGEPPGEGDMRQPIRATVEACGSAGAWSAAFAVVDSVYGQKRLADVPPWAAKALCMALIVAQQVDKWQLAIRCFALSSPLTAKERTHFAGFLNAATAESPLRLEVVLRHQAALREGLLMHVNAAAPSAVSLDHPRW